VLTDRPKAKAKSPQLVLGFVAELAEAEAIGGWGDTGAPIEATPFSIAFTSP